MPCKNHLFRSLKRSAAASVFLAAGAFGCEALDGPGPELTAPPAVASVAPAAAPATADAGNPRGVQLDSGVQQAVYVAEQPAKDAPAAAAPAIPTGPVLPPPTSEQPLTLEGALLLAGVENPTIALAVQAVQASRADQLQAQALLLPSLNGGFTADAHHGVLQASPGIIRIVNRESMYLGAGAGTRAAETIPIPGVRIFTPLADAFFEPTATRQIVAGRQLDAVAVRNDILLDVTTRYLDLVGAEARLLVVLQSERDLGEVVRLTSNFVAAGAGSKADADRARAEALLFRNREEHAQEEVAVASAELTRLLNMDPSNRIRVNAATIPLLTLVPPDRDLESLVRIAVANRPEVGARAADIAANRTRLHREQARPFLPTFMLGFSAGAFGGGSNYVHPRFGNFDGRTDFDVWAFWTAQNLGFGNLALQRQARARVGQAQAEQVRVIDRIRTEVADARAAATASLEQVRIATRRVETAQEGFRLDMQRIRGLVRNARPIELLNSLNLLAAAREDLIRALVAYDEAEFRLFVALGQPPTLAAPADGQACP